jgi:anthranilate phosphoribosyltransferase
MIPYVLSLYLHLGSQGLIAYNYDTIDEIANASSDLSYATPNNLLIQVDANEIRIAEISPEDLGFVRARLEDIHEEEDLGTTNNDFWRILSGEERGPKRDFIVANAALLLVAAQQVPPSPSGLVGQLRMAIKIVEDLIDSHTSEQNFRQLLAARTQLAGEVA